MLIEPIIQAESEGSAFTTTTVFVAALGMLCTLLSAVLPKWLVALEQRKQREAELKDARQAREAEERKEADARKAAAKIEAHQKAIEKLRALQQGLTDWKDRVFSASGQRQLGEDGFPKHQREELEFVQWKTNYLAEICDQADLDFMDQVTDKLSTSIGDQEGRDQAWEMVRPWHDRRSRELALQIKSLQDREPPAP